MCPSVFLSGFTAVRELAPPGDVATAAQKPLTFEFRNVEMQNDSYRGLQVRCRWGRLRGPSKAGAPAGGAAVHMVLCHSREAYAASNALLAVGLSGMALQTNPSPHVPPSVLGLLGSV